MGFWIFMMIKVLSIPVIMLIIGHIFSKKAPTEINWIFGYRTTRSMKNKETWQFANTLCGRIWKKWSLWTLILSVISMLFFVGKSEEIIGIAGGVLCTLQLIPVLAVIPKVESALRKNFDENGKRK